MAARKCTLYAVWSWDSHARWIDVTGAAQLWLVDWWLVSCAVTLASCRRQRSLVHWPCVVRSTRLQHSSLCAYSLQYTLTYACLQLHAQQS